MERGSRKHILDWTSQADFPVEFMEIIGLSDCTLSRPAIWQPKGYHLPEEICLENGGDRFIPGTDCWGKLADWWLVHRGGANKPNWDLVVTCEIAGKPGLVLVEAKAHERELGWGGKRLRSGASSRSVENHERIGKAIAEASDALNKVVPGVNLLRDTHYQLANRLAYSWKIASMGIPVILVYLGFTGDEGIGNVGKPIKDHAHWEIVMREYMADVVPDNFIDRSLDCGKSHMRMIVRSRPVLEQSKPSTVNNKLR